MHDFKRNVFGGKKEEQNQHILLRCCCQDQWCLRHKEFILHHKIKFFIAIWISIETFKTNTRIIKLSFQIFFITNTNIDLICMSFKLAICIFDEHSAGACFCSKDFCVIKLTICILIVFCFKYLNIFDCVVWTLQRKKCKIIWSLFCIILEKVHTNQICSNKWWILIYETQPVYCLVSILYLAWQNCHKEFLYSVGTHKIFNFY